MTATARRQEHSDDPEATPRALASAARQRALVVLVERHPEEFAKIHDEVRVEMGLQPLAEARPSSPATGWTTPPG